MHKARNILYRLPKGLQAPVRKALRQAGEMDDADKAEKLLRNLARRLESRHSLAYTSIIENMIAPSAG